MDPDEAAVDQAMDPDALAVDQALAKTPSNPLGSPMRYATGRAPVPLDAGHDAETYKKQFPVAESPKLAGDSALDWTARNIAEPVVTPAMGAIGTAMSTLGRPFKTYLRSMTNPAAMMPSVLENTPQSPDDSNAWRATKAATVGLAKTAWHNMWNPADAPTFEDIKKDTHIPTFASEPTIYDRQGNVNYGQALLHGMDAAVNIAGDIGTDPGQAALLGVHPGASPEFAAAEGVARQALFDTAAGAKTLGKFATREASHAVLPGVSDAVKAGQLGVNLRVPFVGKTSAFVPLVPKFMAPALKTLDPIFEVLNKPREWITGPEPSSPEQIMQKQQEGEGRKATQDYLQARIKPMEEQALKSGMKEESMPMIGKAAEVFDGDRNLRIMRGMEGVPDDIPGVSIQVTWPKALQEKFTALEKTHPEIFERAKADYEAGIPHLTPQLREAFEHASTLTPAQQATFWDLAQQIAGLGKDAREFAASQGMRALQITELNAEIKARPQQLFDAIDAIKERHARSAGVFGEDSGQATPHRSQFPDQTFRTADAENAAQGPVQGAMDIPTRVKEAFNTPIESFGSLWNKMPDLKAPELESVLQSMEATGEVTFRDGYFQRHYPSEYEPVLGGPQPRFEQDVLTRGQSKYSGTPTETSGKLKTLADEAILGRLDYLKMEQLIEELYNGGPTNHLDSATLDTLSSALHEQLPNAMKQYNAVPNYVPSKLSEATRAEMFEGKNKNDVNRKGFGMNPEDAMRKGKVSSLGKEYADLGDVKMSGSESSEFYGKGTAATSGGTLLEEAKALPRRLYERFMTKTGMRDIQATAGREFMEQNPLKAWRSQIEHGYYKAMVNEGMDNAVINLYDHVPLELNELIQAARRDGIPTGEMAARAPFRFRNYAEGIESPFEYSAAKDAAEAAYKKLSKDVPVMRPANLADMEAIWAKAGREDWFAENLNVKAKAALKAGKPLSEAITENWSPAGRDYVELGDVKGFIHKGVASELSAYKRLGNDPLAIARWFRTNAPVFVWLNTMLKKIATVHNPAFASYMFMKQAHDLSRGSIQDIWDLTSASEIVRGQPGHLRYAETGDFSGLPAYNLGKEGMVSGVDVANRVRRFSGVMDQSGEIAQELQSAGTNRGKSMLWRRDEVPGINSMDASNAGTTMENIIKGQDTAQRVAAWAALKRKGFTDFEAAFQVNQAFFDFTRRGVVTQAVSQLGPLGIPFAAWHAKVIPFMLNWMIKNPGEFMIVQKILQELNAGLFPPSQLPARLRDSTTMPVTATKDKDGHVQVTFASDEGVIPGNDVDHLAKSITRNGGFSWAQQHLGGALRVLMMEHDMNARDEKDAAATTGLEDAGRLAKSFLGHAGTVASRLADPEQQGFSDVLNNLANPIRVEKVDMTQQGIASVHGAAKGLKISFLRVEEAAKRLEDAQDDADNKRKLSLQADVLKLGDRDPIVLKATRALQAAQAAVIREQKQFDRELVDYKRAERITASMTRTP